MGRPASRDLTRLFLGHFFGTSLPSPQNGPSIAFHRAMGFTASDPIKDYDGPSLDRVVFVRSV